MTKKDFLEQLDEGFLAAERGFFRRNDRALLFNPLNGAILMTELSEGTSVYMEIYFEKEREYKWLCEQQDDPLLKYDRTIVFAFGKRPAKAREQLQKCSGEELASPTRPSGIRIFQLWDQCFEHPSVDWNVQISVVNAFDKVAELIAERLEIAFKNFFMPIPYTYLSITH